MQTEIFVAIYSYDALNQGSDMVVDVTTNSDGQQGLTLQSYDSTSTTQVWQLIPNLVTGAYCMGMTLYNPGLTQDQGQILSMYNPGTKGQQVTMNDDPTPWGASAYCWTMFNAGTFNGEQLLTIQDNQRGLCLNASGGSIEAGTQLIMWSWESGTNDNSKWLLKQVPAPGE